VRSYQVSDLEALECIARSSHRDSRFYNDPQFDKPRCDDLYAAWIRRSCEARSDHVFVATDQNQPSGYMTVTGNSIGLVAVTEHARGRGLGIQLVTAAQRYFSNSDAGYVEVVTQGRNRAARDLYLRCGFRVFKAQHWYHLHV